MLAQQQTNVNLTNERNFKKPFKQCFWQANGNLNCQNPTILPDSATPESICHFNTFSEPNANYAPSAYRAQNVWYESKNPPCCKLPCKQGCENTPANYMRQTIPPPRGPSSERTFTPH
jgi:hypothetical protein